MGNKNDRKALFVVFDFNLFVGFIDRVVINTNTSIAFKSVFNLFLNKTLVFSHNFFADGLKPE